jgi:hypothetical protein
LGRNGGRRSGRRARRRTPVAEEEEGDLGVDSARLGDVLGVQEEEGGAAVLLVPSGRRGAVGNVAFVKLEVRPWRSWWGRSRERGKLTWRRRKRS